MPATPATRSFRCHAKPRRATARAGFLFLYSVFVGEPRPGVRGCVCLAWLLVSREAAKSRRATARAGFLFLLTVIVGEPRTGVRGCVCLAWLLASREAAKGNARAGHWLLVTAPSTVSGAGSEGTIHFEARRAWVRTATHCFPFPIASTISLSTSTSTSASRSGWCVPGTIPGCVPGTVRV